VKAKVVNKQASIRSLGHLKRELNRATAEDSNVRLSLVHCNASESADASANVTRQLNAKNVVIVLGLAQDTIAPLKFQKTLGG